MTPDEASLPKNRSRVLQYLNRKALERHGEPITEYQFPLGAKVRVMLVKGALSKEHKKTYSEEIYTVKERKRRDNVNYYVLDNSVGDTVRCTFKGYELTPVSNLPLPPFTIDTLLSNTRTIDGVLHRLVTWKNYPARTYIPEAELAQYQDE